VLEFNAYSIMAGGGVDVYYKEKTGMKSDEGSPLDYFKVLRLGEDYTTISCFAEVLFYDVKEEDRAVARRITWQPLSDSISKMELDLFNIKAVSTTMGETISLQDPILQE